MNNEKRKSNTILLLTGALIGAAATYYLNTPEGKKLTKKVISKTKEKGESLAHTATDLKEQAIERAHQVSENIKSRTNDLVTNASEQYDLVKSKLINKSEQIVSQAEEKLDDLEIGANIAKQAIQNGSLS